MSEPFARLQSVEARRIELLVLFCEAQRAGNPPRLRRSFPLFYQQSWRGLVAVSRFCPTCFDRVRSTGLRGPVRRYCSQLCAKYSYNFSPRKRTTRAAWSKRLRDTRRAAGQCIGCGHPGPIAAYCCSCRPSRRGPR